MLLHNKQHFSPKFIKNSYEYKECLQTLCSLEYIEAKQKNRIGCALIHQLHSKGSLEDFEYWAVGRLGSRTLMHGSIADILSTKIIGMWIDSLLQVKDDNSKYKILALKWLGAETGYPQINIGQGLRKKIEEYIKEPLQGKTTFMQKNELLKQQEEILGDKLPNGLHIQV